MNTMNDKIKRLVKTEIKERYLYETERYLYDFLVLLEFHRKFSNFDRGSHNNYKNQR